MKMEALARTLGEQTGLDAAASAVQGRVQRAMATSPAARTVLHGTWLGHSLHAVLTDVPVGAWTAGMVLDALELTGDGVRRGRGDAVHAVGLAGAVGAAVTGLADWSHTSGPARRLGFVHAAANGLVATLFGASLVARARGHRRAGLLLSTVGYGGLLFSGWLGGELAYGHGVGVNRTALQPGGPEGWTDVLDEAELPEGAMRRVEADGMPVLLVRRGFRVHALADTCAHMGCSLSEGTLRDDVVTCACHGSQFRLSDGHAITGPATSGQPVLEARLAGGRIAVRRPPAAVAAGA
jgi:nitrite reductase/ring-hydroxylating ferredoxin subunit/uncharacterized membrane protein